MRLRTEPAWLFRLTDVTYWLRGPRDYTGESTIVLVSDGYGDRAHFEHVEKAGRVQDVRSRRLEWFDIYVCRTFAQAALVMAGRLPTLNFPSFAPHLARTTQGLVPS